MVRIVVEIVVGIILFFAGAVFGIIFMCMCQASGEAEKQLNEENHQ